MARLAFKVLLVQRDRPQWVPLQIIMVIEILIAQRYAVHSLTHQRQQVMFNEVGVAMLRETRRQVFRDAQTRIYLAQQHRPAIRTDESPVKRALNGPPIKPCKFYPNCCTLCFHKADSCLQSKMLRLQFLCKRNRLLSIAMVKYSG